MSEACKCPKCGVNRRSFNGVLHIYDCGSIDDGQLFSQTEGCKIIARHSRENADLTAQLADERERAEKAEAERREEESRALGYLRALKAISADERDCFELAGAICDDIECYEGDDLLSRIVWHIQPLIGSLAAAEGQVAAMRAAIEAIRANSYPLDDLHHDHGFTAAGCEALRNAFALLSPAAGKGDGDGN